MVGTVLLCGWVTGCALLHGVSKTRFGKTLHERKWVEVDADDYLNFINICGRIVFHSDLPTYNQKHNSYIVEVWFENERDKFLCENWKDFIKYNTCMENAPLYALQNPKKYLEPIDD